MSKARIALAFKGDPYTDGEIDIKEIAPALLALADACHGASRVLAGDSVRTTLKLQAGQRRGSFIVDLILDVDFLKAVQATFFALSITEAKALFDVLFGNKHIGVVGFLTALRGAPPRSIEPIDARTSRVEPASGPTIIVPNGVINVAGDLNVAHAISNMTDPLRVGRASEMEVLDGDKVRLSINRHDAALLVPPVDEQPGEVLVPTSSRQMVLEVERIDFANPRRWRFSEGDSSWSATVTDEQFLADVHAKRISFVEGTLVTASVAQHTTIVAGRLQTEREVSKIRIHGQPKQDRLPLEAPKARGKEKAQSPRKKR